MSASSRWACASLRLGLGVAIVAAITPAWNAACAQSNSALPRGGASGGRNLHGVKPGEVIVRYDADKVLICPVGAAAEKKSLVDASGNPGLASLDRVHDDPRFGLRPAQGRKLFRTAADTGSLIEDRAAALAAFEEIRSKYSNRKAAAGAGFVNLSDIYVLPCAAGFEEQAAEALSRDANVVFATPVRYMSIAAVALPDLAYIPDDFYIAADDGLTWREGSWGQPFPDLWGLERIRVLAAHNDFVDPANDPGAGVVVAIVDTGLDMTHPDVADNVWVNVDEISSNGLDDDRNGFVDDVNGYDLLFSTPDPTDDNGHGTHVAGTIAAVGNNGIGVIGVAPNARLMPVKAFTSAGGSAVDVLANALRYAADNGAQVINNSWGPSGRFPSEPTIEAAVRYAYGLGAVVVFAASNDDDNVAFYSPQNMAETITVGASDVGEQRSFFSNYGARIDFVAPGGGPETPPPAFNPRWNILSLRAAGSRIDDRGEVGADMLRLSGTSMACPHAAGLAALILSLDRDLDNEEVREILRRSADDLGVPGVDLNVGSGRVNAQRAIAVTLIWPDCNGNGTTDATDVAAGTSADCNSNGVPDECMVREADCNRNGVPDGCDIATGSRDCDDNGVPDECDDDCNFNGVPDGCDVAGGTSADVNANGAPDECERLLWVPFEYATIQGAIDSAQDGQTVLIAEGVYSGPGNRNIDFRGKRITVRGAAGPDGVVIDCGGSGRGFLFENGEGPMSRLERLTVRNGSANNGGAIRCLQSSPTISKCIIASNTASAAGGGIYAQDGGPKIIDCIVRDNVCNNYPGGGGIHAFSGVPTITRCTIQHNVAAKEGGGIWLGGAGIVEDSLITDNSATWGGGICVFKGAAVIRNCTFADNEATSLGGGAYFRTGVHDVVNCNMWGNVAPAGFGPELALVSQGSGAATLPVLVSVSFSNVRGGEADGFLGSVSDATLEWGPGNIDADPLFVDVDGADDDPATWQDNNYRLSSASPCIDAGDNSVLRASAGIDLDGHPRAEDAAWIADSGEGPAAIVDLGAYEHQDCNGNGLPDDQDIAECDGSPACRDCNANGWPDGCETDCNGNEVPDECDLGAGTSTDCTSNGVADECEPDCDGNQIADSCDVAGGASQDCNHNLLPDQCEEGGDRDCDGAALSDLCDIFLGLAADCNGNSMPDHCEVAGGVGDCDGNGIPDACESDCDGNAVPDRCDIEGGTASDCNENGIPDGCELAIGVGVDCNGNFVLDECETSMGTGGDCNSNGILDECDLSNGIRRDCNANATPDDCEPDEDCNLNGVQDICDVAAGTSADCNFNEVPDECEPEDDCNLNGAQDICDVAGGTSDDCNGTGRPDECELAAGTSADCNVNGTPDECEITVVALPWWSSRTATSGVIEAFDEAVRLGETTAGQVEGSIELPFDSIWFVRFRIRAYGDGSADPVDHVDVYFNGQFAGRYLNQPIGQSYLVNAATEGGSLAFRFEFVSSTTTITDHMIVFPGVAVAAGDCNLNGILDECEIDPVLAGRQYSIQEHGGDSAARRAGGPGRSVHLVTPVRGCYPTEADRDGDCLIDECE